MHFRAPARHIAECCRADKAQALCVHQLRAPAGTWAFLAEARCERAKTQGKLVLAGQCNGQIMAEKHAVGLQQQLAIEKDIANRSKSGKMECGGTRRLL